MDLNSSKTEARNLAGGHSHEISDPREALRMVTITNLLEDTYYEDDSESLEKLVERFQAAANVDPEFPLRLAAWARRDAYVRDVPQVLLVLSARHDDAKHYVRRYASHVIDRADELCTTLAFNNTVAGDGPGDFSATVPWVLKRAIADVIEDASFDAYQYAKYRQGHRAVSMHDVFNQVHPYGYEDSPEPVEEQSEIANRITKGGKDAYPDVQSLSQRRTWEDTISAAGQDGDVTANDWRLVLDDMGLFARVRNLRNMLEAGLTGEEILEDASDEWIRNSQLYPFRFYQARKALKGAVEMDRYAHQWLENAVNVACETVPDELVHTATLVDLSGSMQQRVSNRSDLSRVEIAALFGAMLGQRRSDVIAFADTATRVPVDPLENSVLSLQEAIVSTDVGSSTFAHKALEFIADESTDGEVVPDRVVVFTDFQIWERQRYGNDPNAFRGAWERLREMHSEEPYLYIVDLASYGEIKFPENYPGVTRLQGWNDGVLDYIWHAENSLLDDIQAYEP